MAFATINKGSSYFNTVTYTGTSTTNNITVGFKPDFTWIKRRNSARDHCLFNIISGTNNVLSSNLTSPEEGTGAGGWTATSTGFDVGVFGKTNSSGDTYVGWNWLASNTTTSNTSGSITSTVSANTTAGFSVVSYTGTGSAATIGHGLGSTPKMIITKKRSSTSNWAVYHASLLASQDIRLNLTDAVRTSNGSWNGTRPTSTVFSVQDDDATNLNGATYIGYCFADVKGYSKMGSYTGNGNANGTFVYTGFKPAFILIKNSTSSLTNWNIVDTKRSTSNVVGPLLVPDNDNAEQNFTFLDILSNGFKLRYTSDSNISGNTMIYAAFAENPFVLTDGTPVTAR